MLRRNRWVGVVIVLLAAADWASKLWVVNRVPLGQTRAVGAEWLFLAHRQNAGVAFSLLAGHHLPWRAPLVVAATLLALALFTQILRQSTEPCVRAGAALVIGGAVGNLGDRLVNGRVTDFILVQHLPVVFNLADTAITLGGILLVLRLLCSSEPSAEPTAPAG